MSLNGSSTSKRLSTVRI